MELGSHLNAPRFERGRLESLYDLADMIDGADPSEGDSLLEQFNREARTHLRFQDFQGINESTDVVGWVRDQLTRAAAREVPALTDAEYLEIIRRLSQAETTLEEHEFFLSILQQRLNPRIGDMIFRPGLYFNDPYRLMLTPEEIFSLAQAST